MFAAHQKLMMVLPRSGIKFIFAHAHSAGLNDTEDIREKYSQIMMDRLQKKTGEDLLSYIDFKRSDCFNDLLSITILTKAMHTDLQIH